MSNKIFLVKKVAFFIRPITFFFFIFFYVLLLLQTEPGSSSGSGEALAKFSRICAELYWDFAGSIPRPVGGQAVPRNGVSFTHLSWVFLGFFIRHFFCFNYFFT